MEFLVSIALDAFQRSVTCIFSVDPQNTSGREAGKVGMSSFDLLCTVC